MKIISQNQLKFAFSGSGAAAQSQGSRVGGAGLALNATSQPTQHEKIEKQARTWVGQTFFGAMLKQMRDSPFKSKLFDGGRGGEAFGTMLDAHLAQRMAAGVGSRIVRPMVRSLEKAAAKKGAGANPYQPQIQKQSTGADLKKELNDVRFDRRA